MVKMVDWTPTEIQYRLLIVDMDDMTHWWLRPSGGQWDWDDRWVVVEAKHAALSRELPSSELLSSKKYFSSGIKTIFPRTHKTESRSFASHTADRSDGTRTTSRGYIKVFWRLNWDGFWIHISHKPANANPALHYLIHHSQDNLRTQFSDCWLSLNGIESLPERVFACIIHVW